MAALESVIVELGVAPRERGEKAVKKIEHVTGSILRTVPRAPLHPRLARASRRTLAANIVAASTAMSEEVSRATTSSLSAASRAISLSLSHSCRNSLTT